MADLAGLLLGTVALASVFGSCVELFEWFELAQNHEYDYHIACTKLSLLYSRLKTWGASLGVAESGHEHPMLRQRWKEEREIIGRSLLGIKQIFEDAALLAGKYKLTAEVPRADQPTLPSQTKGLLTEVADRRPPKTKTGFWRSLRKRTVWAIHDKQKFDGFIGDLSFLIANLETVGDRIAKSSSLKESITTNLPPNTYPPIPSCSKTSMRVEVKSKALDINALAKRLDGAVFIGNQRAVESGTVLMGSIGKSDRGRNLHSGNQTASGNSLAVMGSISNVSQPR